MGKQNQSFKKIGKQILSINNLIESYFNSLKIFLLNIKKFKLNKNNKVFFGLVAFVFLTLFYFLIPTAYNKDLIQTEIKNQILKKYQINLKFNQKINYGLFPKHHFFSRDVNIFNNKKKIADVENLKVFIGFKNFFKINKIDVKNILVNKSEFNIKISDLSFIKNILKIEPNKNKVEFNKSNIFFRDKDGEVLFINQVDNSNLYYDFNNLKNIFVSKNKIFNVPYKLVIKNDKLNKYLETTLDSNSLRLKIDNEVNYNQQDLDGIFKVNFKNKKNLFEYEIKKNSLDFRLKDKNKIYNGFLEFKPFYFDSSFFYNTLKIKDLIENSFFTKVVNSQIFNNQNLNAKINFKVKKLLDFDRFTDLFLNLKIEEGQFILSNSKIMWKDNLKFFLEEGLLSYDDDRFYFNGKLSININDKDDFYRFFQINKEYRKDLNQIVLDFNYDFFKKKIIFDNLKIDNTSNPKLDKLISDFNLTDEKFFNKITFKNFVNKVFISYSG